MEETRRDIPLEEGSLRVICAGCQRTVSAAVTIETEKGRLCPDCALPAERQEPQQDAPAA